MKRSLFAASLALVAATTVACGDSSSSDTAADEPAGPPTTASTEEFCGTFEDFISKSMELGADPEPAEAVKVLHEVADSLEEVGSPEDMPEDARAGFELVVTTLQELPDDATKEDLEGLDADFSEEDQANSDAFDAYLQETCQPAGSEAPSEPSSEEPSN